MAYRGGGHGKETRRMDGCGTKGQQRRARSKNCLHGARISYQNRKGMRS